MKVFISWSGDQSKAFAVALKDWLPLVIHFAEPWVSDADIEAGERWANEVGKELENSNFGVICIDRENVGSQWLLFEAGALSRSMQEGRVIPLLFDIEFKDISGPLAQFQAKKFDSKGMWDVVCALNKLGETPILDSRLKQLFDALWPDLEKAIEAIPKKEKNTHATRPQTEVLEELVASVRGLDVRLRDVAEGASDLPSRRRMSRVMQREVMSMIEAEPGDPIRLLMLASTVREDLPWLYEVIAEAYRQEISGNYEKANRAKLQLMKTIRGMPLSRFVEDKGVYEMFHELEYWLRHTSRMEPPPSSPARTPKNSKKESGDS